jgi:dephospho-CoA kinase
MKVIGLCGGSGSGKGLACSFFDELGLKCIDTDKVYHDLISKDSECTRELISFFGEGISSDSKIDRKKLRDIILSSDDALEQLNRITHKHILAQARTMIEEYK